MKSMFATICNTDCMIHCKIKMICLINSQKLKDKDEDKDKDNKYVCSYTCIF